MPDRPDLRASDAERERAVQHLREHQLAGRLTVEELDERCERAYSARTVGELTELIADLPTARTPAVRPAAPAEPGGIGRQPFTYVFALTAPPDAAMEAALRTMAPALAHGGAAGAARVRADRRALITPRRRPGAP